MSTPRRRPQAPKRRIQQITDAREIRGVRRLVAPESYKTLKVIDKILKPYIEGVGRLFEISTVSVTVIGDSRYDFKRYSPNDLPATKVIAEAVSSSRQPITATLGSLGVYGSGKKWKLAIGLYSDELVEEFHGFRDEYADMGFELKNDYNCEDAGGYSPHCSVALINTGFEHYFQAEEQLDKLNTSTGLGSAATRTIVLMPSA